MTEVSFAFDDPGFHQKTILFGLESQRSSENNYLHISGYGNYTFTTEEKKIIFFMFSLGDTMLSYPIAVWKKTA